MKPLLITSLVFEGKRGQSARRRARRDGNAQFRAPTSQVTPRGRLYGEPRREEEEEDEKPNLPVPVAQNPLVPVRQNLPVPVRQNSLVARDDHPVGPFLGGGGGRGEGGPRPEPGPGQNRNLKNLPITLRTPSAFFGKKKNVGGTLAPASQTPQSATDRALAGARRFARFGADLYDRGTTALSQRVGQSIHDRLMRRRSSPNTGDTRLLGSGPRSLTNRDPNFTTQGAPYSTRQRPNFIMRGRPTTRTVSGRPLRLAPPPGVRLRLPLPRG